jgi:hypothetical protein
MKSGETYLGLELSNGSLAMGCGGKELPLPLKKNWRVDEAGGLEKQLFRRVVEGFE